MNIGIPREIKPKENRVACTPGGAHMLVSAGHEVMVEKGAGVGSGFPDEQYIYDQPVARNRANPQSAP